MGSGASCRELGQVQKGRGGRAKEVRQRAPAEHTYDTFARKMAGMPPEEGAAILRPSPKGVHGPREGRNEGTKGT